MYWAGCLLPPRWVSVCRCAAFIGLLPFWCLVSSSFGWQRSPSLARLPQRLGHEKEDNESSCIYSHEGSCCVRERKRFQVPSSRLEKQVACPSCGSALTVPKPMVDREEDYRLTEVGKEKVSDTFWDSHLPHSIGTVTGSQLRVPSHRDPKGKPVFFARFRHPNSIDLIALVCPIELRVLLGTRKFPGH